jgi:hypothetical protein
MRAASRDSADAAGVAAKRMARDPANLSGPCRQQLRTPDRFGLASDWNYLFFR